MNLWLIIWCDSWSNSEKMGFWMVSFIFEVILLILKEMKQRQQYTNNFSNSLFFCSPESAFISIGDFSENTTWC